LASAQKCYQEEEYWQKPIIGGYLPAPRYQFAMAINGQRDSQEIMLVGGRTVESFDNRAVYVLVKSEEV